MNRKQTWFRFVSALALLGSAIAGLSQDNSVESDAIVQTVKGKVEYSDGDKWLQVKADLHLPSGTTLRTGPDSGVSLNTGMVSCIELAPRTTLQLQKMVHIGAGRDADTQTLLDLKGGTVNGSCGRVSGKSDFQIHTPNGTASVRGSRFSIEAAPQADGAIRVTYSSHGGEMLCEASVEGKSVSKTLGDGESWTPGEKGNEDLRPPGSHGLFGTNSASPTRLTPEQFDSLQETASNYNSFGFALLQSAAKIYPKTNIFLSPLSAAFALSLARSGARGATQQEMMRALRLEGRPPAGVDEANEKMLDFLSSLTGLKLEIANALWASEKSSIKPDFTKNALDFYNADARSVNFQSPTTIAEINSWVNTRTHGTIPEILTDLDPRTVMVIADAIYFKAKWQDPFDKKLTRDKPFKLERGGNFLHPRMQRADYFQYYETGSVQMVALPYVGSSTMYVLLPHGSLEKFVQGLTPEKWEEWTSHLEGRKGLLELPRFKLKNEYELKPVLQALGVRLAFEEGRADFSGTTDQPAWIEKVIHKTYVDVNEEGTEASAVTMIIEAGAAPPPPKPPFKMIVDHPFFFVIQENETEAILFMGAIMDPR